MFHRDIQKSPDCIACYITISTENPCIVFSSKVTKFLPDTPTFSIEFFTPVVTIWFKGSIVTKNQINSINTQQSNAKILNYHITNPFELIPCFVTIFSNFVVLFVFRKQCFNDNVLKNVCAESFIFS